MQSMRMLTPMQLVTEFLVYASTLTTAQVHHIKDERHECLVPLHATTVNVCL